MNAGFAGELKFCHLIKLLVIVEVAVGLSARCSG